MGSRSRRTAGSSTYNYDARGERTGVNALLEALRNAGVAFRDLRTTESTLEDIFVDLVRLKT